MSERSSVTCDGVWKKFRRGERYDSLRDLIPALTRRVFGGGRAPRFEAGREFWALRDVSFQVAPGEALGIIGPNGAGKSTVLKMLTKILKPTRGRCEVRGRVGALIEIAAGFHPDLTGRENIYLQGAVMGMKRQEIQRNFDQIIEFSGIPEFIDTPVKRYSSGMNARLGFSIAASLDPDVLVIDEVLSVGDFAFQQKAFEHLRELVSRQIPVVIVSHKLSKISELCSHAILLERGGVVRAGSPEECIGAYVMGQPPSQSSCDNSHVRLTALFVEPTDFAPSGSHVTLGIEGVTRPGHSRDSEVVFVRLRAIETGQVLFQTSNVMCGLDLPEAGGFALELDLQLNVQPGAYLVEALLRNPKGWQLLDGGQRTRIQVTESRAFGGIVQMNPRMRLARSPCYDSGLGAQRNSEQYGSRLDCGPRGPRP